MLSVTSGQIIQCGLEVHAGRTHMHRAFALTLARAPDRLHPSKAALAAQAGLASLAQQFYCFSWLARNVQLHLCKHCAKTSSVRVRGSFRLRSPPRRVRRFTFAAGAGPGIFFLAIIHDIIHNII